MDETNIKLLIVNVLFVLGPAGVIISLASIITLAVIRHRTSKDLPRRRRLLDGVIIMVFFGFFSALIWLNSMVIGRPISNTTPKINTSITAND